MSASEESFIWHHITLIFKIDQQQHVQRYD